MVRKKLTWSNTPTKNLIFLCLLLLGCVVAPGSALSIKFTDQSMAGTQNLDVYSVVNGTHLYTGNTSSQFNVDESVIVHISPDRVDYIRNPTAFLENAKFWISDNILEIIVLCIAVAIIVRR